MNEKFFDLPRQKQDRMINGAIEVFAKNGYRHASTDDMVKAVGVSKGLWFHYFGSKEGIYVFAYDYCVKYMLLELSTEVDEMERDYFELARQVAFAKTKVYRSYPYLAVFLEEAARETQESIVTQTADPRRAYDARMESLLGAAQVGGVADAAKQERIKKLLDYAVNGIIRDRTREGADADTIYKEIVSYIALVRELVLRTPDKAFSLGET